METNLSFCISAYVSAASQSHVCIRVVIHHNLVGFHRKNLQENSLEGHLTQLQPGPLIQRAGLWACYMVYFILKKVLADILRDMFLQLHAETESVVHRCGSHGPCTICFLKLPKHPLLQKLGWRRFF